MSTMFLTDDRDKKNYNSTPLHFLSTSKKRYSNPITFFIRTKVQLSRLAQVKDPTARLVFLGWSISLLKSKVKKKRYF
jgi:hypothetical protein